MLRRGRGRSPAGRHTGTLPEQRTRRKPQLERTHTRKNAGDPFGNMHTKSSTQALHTHRFKCEQITHLENKHTYQISPSESTQTQLVSISGKLSVFVSYSCTRNTPTHPTQQKRSGFPWPGSPRAPPARAPRARCKRVLPPRWTPGLERGALIKSCLPPDPPKEKKAKSQPFVSILHTFGERLVTSDPKICFHRCILDGRGQSQ